MSYLCKLECLSGLSSGVGYFFFCCYEMKKHPDIEQDGGEKTHFTLQLQRDTVHHGREGLAAGALRSMWPSENSNHFPSLHRRRTGSGDRLKCLKARPLVMYFLLRGTYFLKDSATSWELSVQTCEPTGAFLLQTQHLFAAHPP